MRDIKNYEQGECLGPKTGATHYHAQLGLPDTGRAVKGFVVCYCMLYVVVWLRIMIYGIGLWTSARSVVWSLVLVRMAIELKYPNTPQIHKTSNKGRISTFIKEKLNKSDRQTYIDKLECYNIREYRVSQIYYVIKFQNTYYGHNYVFGLELEMLRLLHFN